MVEPDDGVPALLAGHRDAELAACRVAHHERAGGVEADAGDAFGRDAGLSPARRARRCRPPPDILRIMLGMIGLGLVHGDRMFGAAKQGARAVENARAGAPGPDIDRADETVPSRCFCSRSQAWQSDRAIAACRRISGRARARRKPRFQRRIAGMRAAGEGEDAHARRPRRLDAGRAVLDDDAILRGWTPIWRPHGEKGRAPACLSPPSWH